VVDDRATLTKKKKRRKPPAYDSDKLEAKIRLLAVADRQRLLERLPFMEGF